MKTLTFANGDQMPMLGLGTWKAKPDQVYQAVKEALRLGYRHIDCAAIYENEAEVGRALREAFQEGLVTREQVWVTSKLWNDAHAPEDVEPALKKTLTDLQLTYLDLYLIHWPVSLKRGITFPRSADDFISPAQLPASKTWSAMEDLVSRGLCRHVGVSNFSETKLRELMRSARQKPEVNQVELHPYLQQTELLAFCEQNDILLTAYSPLGSKDRAAPLKGKDEPVLLEDPIITKIAARHQITPAQVLLAWALMRGTAVIPKSVHPERLTQNLAAADVTLDDAAMREIAGLERGFRYVSGSFWASPGSPFTLASLWG